MCERRILAKGTKAYMSNERVITLGDDGVFAAPIRDAACYLMFDSTVSTGRWLLSYDHGEAEYPSLVSIHANLDTGLKAMAELAGWGGRRFTVILSDEEKFIRPGKVPASEVMAALGYILVPSIRAFAIYDPGFEAERGEVEAIIRERLAGKSVTIGSVDYVGVPDTAWCCDLTLPFEGYIFRADIEHFVSSSLADVNLELSDVCEGRPFFDVAPNRADVTQIYDEAA